MPNFDYKARDRSGASKSGSLEAPTRALALQSLQNQGLVPLAVNEAKAEAKAAKSKKKASNPRKQDKATTAAEQVNLSGKKLGMSALLQFSIDLRDLLSAGLTVGSSIQKLSQQAGNPVRQHILKELHTDIVQGKSLSEAMAGHPKSFPEFYVSLIRAGEASGHLQDALEDAVRHYERSAETREEVVSALVYPCIVLVFGILIIILCIVFVVPKFAEVFEGIGQTLPGPTRMLMNTSDFMVKYGLFVLIAITALVVLFNRWKRTPNGRRSWDAFLLKMPLFNKVIRSSAYANFARTLANLLQNGVPVLNALDIVKITTNNAILEEQVTELKDRVTDGSSLSRPLAESGVFPDVFTDMLSIGEETGQIPRSLTQIARRYDQELSRDVKRMTTLLEPLLMVIIAAAVGFVALSMLLPVFQISQGLR